MYLTGLDYRFAVLYATNIRLSTRPIFVFLDYRCASVTPRAAHWPNCCTRWQARRSGAEIAGRLDSFAGVAGQR